VPEGLHAAAGGINSEARSLDGTSIPITILKSKGSRAAGYAGVVMGMAAYGMVITQPAFNPLRLEWAAPAICCVGGYSRWRPKGDAGAGRQGLKTNTRGIGISFAAAEHSSINTTHRRHIALYSGARAGSLWVVQSSLSRRFRRRHRPCGMLNPTRPAVDTKGANQYSEFGDPTTEGGFKQLYAMDAYTNIKDEVGLSGVLLMSA